MDAIIREPYGVTSSTILPLYLADESGRAVS